MKLLTTNFCTEAQTTVTASTEDTYFPVSNLQNPLRSKRWRSTSDSAQYVVFDMQTAEEINTVVLMWPKEDGIRLSDAVTLKVQANATNVWTSPAVDQVISISNDFSIATLHFVTPESYRYWRIYIDDPGNAWGYVELGQVWIGMAESIDNAQNGFKRTLIDRSTTVSTDFGHKYVDEYPVTQRLEFSYANIDYDTILVLETAFRTNGNRKPVIVILDPTEVVFDKDNYCVYGMMGNSFASNHVMYDIFNSDTLVVEELS